MKPLKLDKKAISMIAVYGILAVVYLLAFLFIPFHKNAASWISFLFTILAIAGSLGISLYAFGEEKSLVGKIYGFPIFKIGAIYAVAQLVLGIVICVIAAFVKVPYWVALLVGIFFMAFAAIGVILTENTRKYIEEKDEETTRIIKSIKTFQMNVEGLADQCENPVVKKEIEKLAEKVRFSDPVSSEATEAREKELAEEVEELKEMLRETDAAEVIKKIQKIGNKLAERNRICKESK